MANASSDAPGIDVHAVYKEHADFVWRTLSRMGVKPEDLKDMTQEVFLVVHRQSAAWKPEARVTTWLYGICRKVASGYRRRAFRRYEEAVAEMPEQAAGDAVQPDESVAARDARRQLDRILDTLKPDQRAVFVMFEIDEMSCEAIAEETGTPLGTVFSRLRAARQAFERGLKRFQAAEARRQS